MQKRQCGMRRLFAFFFFFFTTIFQKQTSNDQLTQGNLLKWTLLNENQNIKLFYGLSFDTQFFLQWKKVAMAT